jgi:DNA polymerase III epsilon subunit-like protein
MPSTELEGKRKREDDEEQPETPLAAQEGEDGFEIPKAHLREAKRREKISKPSAVIQKAQNRTTVFDVRNVVLWVLSEAHGSMPKWCIVRNKNLVSGVTVIITPFIDRHTLFEHAGSSIGISQQLPFFSHCIRGCMIPMTAVPSHRYPSICPVLSTFLTSPASNKNGQWISTLSDNEDENIADTTKLARPPISEFLMTEENRRAHDMPELLAGGYPPPGYVTTKGKKTGNLPAFDDDESLHDMLSNKGDQEWLEKDKDYTNLVGMDCEMVETVNGKELARVSLVDHKGRVLYDSVVLPENEVTDYLTQYSGITANMLRECRTSFKEAQKQVLACLREDSILVGHAIDNDMKCMKLVHERVIDTSDIFPHPNGFPSKHSLVFLLGRVLRETLDREGGHDSVDDAKASLRIAMKKFSRGHDYAPGGMGASRYYALGSLLDCKGCLKTEAEIATEKYRLDKIDVNPESLEDSRLRIHVLRDYQSACENNEPRVDALAKVDTQIRDIVSKLDENHLVITFSGCGDIFAFKRFEALADQCEDETKRFDVEKMLQRAKDKAVSAFAIISTVGDLPAVVRNNQ